MNSKEFKDLFGEIAKLNNFQKAFGGWFKDSTECIAVLELQKSNYGDYYQLIIKIYIQGMFGDMYAMNKNLVKKDIGHIFSGEPKEYKKVFDLTDPITDNMREELLKELFQTHIVPFTDNTISKDGIIEKHQKEGLFLLPNLKKELGILEC